MSIFLVQHGQSLPKTEIRKKDYQIRDANKP